MKFEKLAGGIVRPAVCVAAVLSSTAVYAEVTAQQVWDDWKANMAVYGNSSMTIGSEVAEGGTLTVTDLGVNSTFEGGSVTGNLASLVLTEQGDGTVAVTMSESYPLTLTSTTNGEQSVMNVVLNQSGLTMVVSGTPEEMTYTVDAAKYTVEMNDVTDASGAVMPVAMTFTLNNMSGTYVTTPGELRTIDYDIAAESADLVFDATDPETGAKVTFSGKMNELASIATMTIPPLDTAGEEIFNAGMAIAGGFTVGAASYLFSSMDPDTGETSGAITAMGGSLDFSFNRDAMGYDNTITGLTMDLTSTAMPFPVKLSIAEYGLGLLFPLAKTDTPTDWAAYLNLTDLAVNDEVWTMIDAGNVLPHDPATVVMDLTGTATMSSNILDPAEQAAMAAGAAPGVINSMSINDITLRIAGAEVMGTGALTFDNTDLTTFSGVPAPTGKVDLKVTGANKLMDTLIAMGMMSEDDAMGARMMLSMFANPGAGEDEFTSVLEFKDKGFYANGQRLQ